MKPVNRPLTIICLAWVICLMVVTVSAQRTLSTEDIRQASGHGPYPIYLTAQFSRTSTITEYRLFSKAFDEWPGAAYKKVLRGGELNLGFIINEENLPGEYIYGLSFEGGFKRLARELKGNGLDLLFQEDIASFRVGWRMPLYYPLGVHFQGGPVLYYRGRVRREIDTGAEPFSEEIRWNSNGKLISGWDLRARFTILDPAGTTGGLGLFLEWRWHLSTLERDLSKVYDWIEFPSRDPVRWNYLSFSFGAIVPLALQIR